MKFVLMVGKVAALGVMLGACQMTAPPVQSPPTYQPPRAAPPSSYMPPSATPPSSNPRRRAPPVAPPVSPPRGDDTCGAGRLQHLVGGPLPQPFPAQGPVRIFATGQPVTMDYSAHRLNVEVAGGNRQRIVAITCG